MIKAFNIISLSIVEEVPLNDFTIPLSEAEVIKEGKHSQIHVHVHVHVHIHVHVQYN